jgi:hypothetical protein
MKWSIKSVSQMTLMGEGTRRVSQRPKTRIDEVEFARTRLGFRPDERQAEVLRSTAKRGILNCSRQWGKSTVTVAKALYGEHDDLVIALALACWRARRREIGFGTRRLPGI